MYTFNQFFSLLTPYQQSVFSVEYEKDAHEPLEGSSYQNSTEQYLSGFLRGAFVWSSTPQGIVYWSRLADVLDNKLKENKKEETMNKITLLAELTCLNRLVNGKVIVVDRANNTYKTYNLGKYTPEMPQTFNPEDYALLETEYCPVVILATDKMKQDYLVNKAFTEQFGIKVNIKQAAVEQTYKEPTVGDLINKWYSEDNLPF